MTLPLVLMYLLWSDARVDHGSDCQTRNSPEADPGIKGPYLISPMVRSDTSKTQNFQSRKETFDLRGGGVGRRSESNSPDPISGILRLPTLQGLTLV